MSENRLSDMRAAYLSIPVPDMLEARVRQSVRAAKMTLNRKRALRATRWMAVDAAALLLTVTALANSGADMARAMESIPVLGPIAKAVTFRVYEDEKGDISSRVEVPMVEGAEELNRSAEALTEEIIARYEAERDSLDEGAKYSVEVSYETATDTEALFGLRITETETAADSAQRTVILNADRRTGAVLSLADLFLPDSGWQEALTEEIAAQMRERMAADENECYWIDSEEPEADFVSLPEDAAFYVNAEGELVIVFDEGEVAPMYMGMPEFVIPRERIADIADGQYLK